MVIFKNLNTFFNTITLTDYIKLVKNLQQLFLLLDFLDPNRDQQRQLCTELLTGPVVSNQTRFCLHSCTAFPQFVFTSRRVSSFFFQYHPEDSIAQLVGPLKTHLFAGYVVQQTNLRILAVKSMRVAVLIWTLRAGLKRPDLILVFCLLFSAMRI